MHERSIDRSCDCSFVRTMDGSTTAEVTMVIYFRIRGIISMASQYHVLFVQWSRAILVATYSTGVINFVAIIVHVVAT